MEILLEDFLVITSSLGMVGMIGMTPASILSNVVLPDPLGPMT